MFGGKAKMKKLIAMLLTLMMITAAKAAASTANTVMQRVVRSALFAV